MKDPVTGWEIESPKNHPYNDDMKKEDLASAEANPKNWRHKDDVNIQKTGPKYDSGKPLVYSGAFCYFPNALAEVARLSEFGAKKYAWNSWQNVDDGYVRYSNALGRHLLNETTQTADPESGLLEQVHVAWNALARLELLLFEEKGKLP